MQIDKFESPWISRALISLIFAGGVAGASTSSAVYSLGAVVRLLSHSRRYLCSGTVVGTEPLKVLTAAHCLSNLSDGGIEMLDPSVPDITSLYSSISAMIHSKRVFIAKHADFSRILGEAVAARNELLDLSDRMFALAHKRTEIELKRKALTRNNSATAADFISVLADYDQNAGEITDTGRDLRKSSLSVIAAFNSILNLDRKTAHLDLAVVVFGRDTAFPMANASALYNAGKILPIAREGVTGSMRSLLGGFGLTDFEAKNLTNSANFTTNELLPLAGSADVFTTKGLARSQGDNASIKRGEWGSPLPGDSGGPALTENGISGVTSVTSSAVVTEDMPPREGWPNERENHSSYWDEFEVINAAYASTTSVEAREIFTRVESEFGPLLYNDAATDFGVLFSTHVRNFLESARPEPKTAYSDTTDFELTR